MVIYHRRKHGMLMAIGEQGTLAGARHGKDKKDHGANLKEQSRSKKGLSVDRPPSIPLAAGMWYYNVIKHTYNENPRRHVKGKGWLGIFRIPGPRRSTWRYGFSARFERGYMVNDLGPPYYSGIQYDSPRFQKLVIEPDLCRTLNKVRHEMPLLR